VREVQKPAILTASSQCHEERPPKFFPRSVVTMRFSCAAENGFNEIFTNDRHMLAACAPFGLDGRNLIA
jgi:hypothetical protein